MNVLSIYNLDDYYGEWLLKKSEGSEENILSASSILDWVKEGKFDDFTHIKRTYYKRPYIKVENDKYILIQNVKGKKLKLTDKKQVLSSINCLSRFHLAAEGYLMPSGIKTEASWGRLMEKYKTYVCNLEKYIDLIENRGCINEFEKETKPYLDSLYKIARETIKFFRTEEYIYLIERSMKKREICINDFNQNSVVMIGKEKKPYITKIFSLGYNMCEEDIASMARRHIEETGSIEFIDSIIKEYEKNRELDSISKKSIRLMSTFPETPVKIISKYINKGLYKENMLEKFLSISSIFQKFNMEV